MRTPIRAPINTEYRKFNNSIYYTCINLFTIQDLQFTKSVTKFP